MSNNYKESAKFCCNPEQSDSNDSEWGLEIVIKSTPKKRKQQSIDPKDKEIIDEFEKNIEETLEEKAAKSNLSHTTVKSILKHVFTDEHVLALVKQKEGCEDVEGIIPYEPKITRSKAKELYSNAGSLIPLPWQAPSATSEVQALLTQDLQEDSSDDEYVPGQEESEDDASCTCSISNPPTPIAPPGTPKRDNEVQDEVFKTPQRKEKKNRKQRENANIALRTRSKFSLSQTPLEKIEQAFIPPDITTDMYEMYCKDDEWKEFLTSFTQPLDEVVKGAEDEDHDPEYNFLSDEEIENVDKEELRADKAVKVPRKELNDLMAELFEYVDIYSQKTDKEKMEYETSLDSTNQIQQQLFDSCIEILDCSNSVNPFTTNICHDIPDSEKNEMQTTKLYLSDAFTQSQLCLLHQQIRQHVQMLTQNFLLTYSHPFYSSLSSQLKEYLLNFKFLANSNKNSVFNCNNLENSLKLIDRWEALFRDNNKEALETTKHFEEVIKNSITLHSKGEYYYLPFPPLVLKTIAESDIFIYPYLLPRIPFKHPELLKKDISPFSYSEYQLIALGLEQFVLHFMNDEAFMTKKKQLNLKKISELICDLMMPFRLPTQIYRQMINKKKKRHLPNPIAYYNLHKKAPLTIHQVNPLIHFKTVPPRNRPPLLLPRQWRNYIWPDWRHEIVCEEQHFPKPALILNQEKKKEPPKPLPKLLPKREILLDTLAHPKVKTSSHKYKLNDISFEKQFINCFSFSISYSEYYALNKSEQLSESLNTEPLLSKEDILNNSEMPCLNFSDTSKINVIEGHNKDTSGVQEFKLDTNDLFEDVVNAVPKQLSITCTDKSKCVKSSGARNSNSDSTEMCHIGKDSAEKINDISENVANKNIMFPSTDEDKSKKGNKHFKCLTMLSPPELSSEKETRVQFAHDYFKKIKKTLTKADYIKVMHLLQNSSKKTLNAVDLYKILKPILKPKYYNLADEFVMFLNFEQANAIGKLIPFFLTNHIDEFKKNLEFYFKDQPSLLLNINESSSVINNGVNITLDKVKNIILPLLRHNPLLCDRFLQIFLEESSPSILFNSAWEIDDIRKKLDPSDNKAVSHCVVAAGSESAICVCSCHKIEQLESEKHCLNCGLRFVRDKVYCHSSKGFKQVSVTFPFDPNIDYSAKIENQNNTKSINSSRKKLNLQCGNNVKKKSTISKIKRNIGKSRDINKLESTINSRKAKMKEPVFKRNIFQRNKKNRLKIKIKSRSIFKKKKCSMSESTENILRDANLRDFKVSHTTTRNSSFSENGESWSREEDKIILQTFQQQFNKEAIQLIGKRLKNRSADDIRRRFEVLMALLQKLER